LEEPKIKSTHSSPKHVGDEKGMKGFNFSVEEENESGEDKISNGFLSDLTRSLDDKKTASPSFTKPPLPKPLGLSKSPLDLSKPLGPPKAMLQPLQSLPPLSRTPLHKALPPLDLPKLNSKSSIDEDLDPFGDEKAKTDLHNSKQDENSQEKEEFISTKVENTIAVSKELEDTVDTASSDEESDLLPLNINVDKPAKCFDKKEENKFVLQDDFDIELSQAKNRYDKVLEANKKLIDSSDISKDKAVGKKESIALSLSDDEISISEENIVAEMPSNSKIKDTIDVFKRDSNLDNDKCMPDNFDLNKEEESDCFSDESDNILPDNDSLYKASKTKSLFGLQSDEEEVAKSVATDKSEKKDEKEEATPRSISAADAETGEESDFW